DHSYVTTSYPHRPWPPRFVGAEQGDGEHGKTRADGDPESTLLERSHDTGLGAGALRIYDHRPTLGNEFLGLGVDLLVDPHPSLAVHLDDPDRPHPGGEEGDPKELLLGQKSDRNRQRLETRHDV